MQRLAACLLSLSFIIFAGPMSAADKPPTLSLDRFLETSIRSNHQIRVLRQQYREQRFSAGRTRALRDLTLSIASSYTWKDPLENFGQPIGKKYSMFSFSTSLAKKFPNLAGIMAQLEAGYSGTSFDYIDQSSGMTFPSKQNIPSLSLSITLPLLANSLGSADRATLDSVGLTLRILQKTELEAYESFLGQLYKAYYDWALLEEKTGIYRGFQQRALALLGQTLRKQKVGLADWADVHLTRQNYQRYQALYLATKLQAEQSYLNMVAYMQGKPLDSKAMAAQVESAWQPDLDFKPKQEPQTPVQDFKQLRTVQLAELAVEQAKKAYQAAANLALPDLNLILSGTKESSGDDFSSSFGSFNRDQFYLGLEFKLPLPNTDKGGNAASKKAAFQKTLRDYKNSLVSITYALKNLGLGIQVMTKVVEVNQASVVTSQARVAAMIRKYNQGRATLYNVTDARDAFANARINFLDQSVALKKLIIDYHGLTDALFDKHKKLFEFKD